MEEKRMSEQESLDLIATMISQAKNYYYESGLGSLLWGFTNLICFTLAYLDATVAGFNLPVNPFSLMVITFIIHIYYSNKEKRYRKAKTYIDELSNYVYIAFGICVLILTLGGAVANIGYTTLPVLLLFFGLPTFVTGCVSKFKPYIIGGVICWLFSIVAFLHKGYYAHLLVAAGATAAWIVPGFILRAKYLRSLNV